MATGQTILDLMEGLFPEIQLQSGESGVTKGLRFLNAAQDMFETHASQYGDIFGGQVGTVTTTDSQEYTTYPSGLLRVDKLQMLGDDSLPIYPILPITETGGHAFSNFWPWSLVSTTTTGKPRQYWTNGTRIYWDPIPNGVYTVRYYGFTSASDITAGGTFAYPDVVMLPLAVVAVKLVRTGLDDSIENLTRLAMETFNPVLDSLTGFKRDGPSEYIYTRPHET